MMKPKILFGGPSRQKIRFSSKIPKNISIGAWCLSDNRYCHHFKIRCLPHNTEEKRFQTSPHTCILLGGLFVIQNVRASQRAIERGYLAKCPSPKNRNLILLSRKRRGLEVKGNLHISNESSVVITKHPNFRP